MKLLGVKLLGVKMFGSLDKWFVNKQVVVKLYEQLIAIWSLFLLVVYLPIIFKIQWKKVEVLHIERDNSQHSRSYSNSCI